MAEEGKLVDGLLLVLIDGEVGEVDVGKSEPLGVGALGGGRLVECGEGVVDGKLGGGYLGEVCGESLGFRLGCGIK